MTTTIATAPARQRKPRPKPERRIRLMVKPYGDCPAVVRIWIGTEPPDDYFVTAQPADFGRGFFVEKIGIDCHGSDYHVNLEADKRTCECKGYLRWGYCRHADGLAALIAAGRL
jgi:hypothetical protein